MIISHIVAVSNNNLIGKNNRLPWKMPDDAKYFHDVTMGHVVIMGRKNYEANRRALRGRTNIVISRNRDFRPPDAIVARSIEESVIIAAGYGEEEVFIVGGGEIYRQSMDFVQRIYITCIEAQLEGDVFYPTPDPELYRLVSERYFRADERNPYNWTYKILERISPENP